MSTNYRIALLLTVVAGVTLGFKLVSDSQANVATHPAPTLSNGMKWELIPTSGMQELTQTYRAKVPGGWIVTNIFKGNRTGTGMTFVPDADHSWSVSKWNETTSVSGSFEADLGTKIGPPSTYKPRYDPSTKTLLNPRKTYEKKE